MNNTFDSQIQHLEEVIAKYSLILEFFKKIKYTGEITVKEAMEVGLVWVEINENRKFKNINLNNLNPNAVIKGIENININTIRCTSIVE